MSTLGSAVNVAALSDALAMADGEGSVISSASSCLVVTPRCRIRLVA
jgi:hypothetical protein